MPGNNYVNIAPETTYGTPPATGWKGLAADDDGHEVDMLISQPDAIFYGAQGPSTQGRQADQLGASGSFKSYLPSSGALLLLLRATFGAPTTTTLAVGEAYQHVFSTGALASTYSIATQIGRSFKDGTADRDTYAGGMVKKMQLAQAKRPTSGGTSADGLARTMWDMDYQRMLAPGDFAQKLPTYAVPELYHGVGGHKLWIAESLDAIDDDEGAECLDSFTLSYDPGLDVEDGCATQILKDKPTRGKEPVGDIAMAFTYKHRTYYDAFLSGEILAFRSKYEPSSLEISDGIKPSVTTDVAAFGFTGKTPQMARNERTKQDLPADILHNGTDPMIRVTVITSDATV